VNPQRAGVALLGIALVVALAGWGVSCAQLVARDVVDDSAAEDVQSQNDWLRSQIGSAGTHFTASKDWAKLPHVDAVKNDDPSECFRCHKETWCSACHIKLID
jgi:hypothetical protein